MKEQWLALKGRQVDLVGMRFGRWTVLRAQYKNQQGIHWLCRCDCGTERTVKSATLRKGASQSCGCIAAELLSARRFKHGGSHTRLWNIRGGMISRCENEKSNRYNSYGGRGIRVCGEWRHDFVAFRDWALSHGYRDDLTIDRIDNDGNYEPSNCRWMSLSENTRRARMKDTA